MTLFARTVIVLLAAAALTVNCGNPGEPASNDSTTAQEGVSGEFRPSVSIMVADARATVASDVTLTYRLPGSAFPRLSAVDVPVGWDFSHWRGTAGRIVGTISSDVHIGVANGPCDIPVHAEYRLLSAATDGTVISKAEMSRPPHPDIYRLGDDGLPAGVTHVPSFLHDMRLEGTPYARAYGQSLVHTFPSYVNLVVQDTGDGVTLEFILSDPYYTSPTVTSICGPLSLQLALFGVSPSQPDAPLLMNPPEPGTYTWTLRSAPAPDADGDGFDNALDNCPLDANPDQADADGDALGDVCDPSPDENRNAGDEDRDQVKNAADRCALQPNPDQEDSDLDFIGDACDDEPDTGRAGEIIAATSDVSVATAPAGATTLPSPPDLATLPPVYDPEARGPGQPNPSAPDMDPADAPQQTTGSAEDLGRDDCPKDWLAVQAEGGWSVCHSEEWNYRIDRRWMAGVWHESFSLSKRGGPSHGTPGPHVGSIAIHHQQVGRTGALLPECDQPEPKTLAGLAAVVCQWPPGEPSSGKPGREGVAYYVNFGNGRIALEGVSHDGEPETLAEVVSIFETLRLP